MENNSILHFVSNLNTSNSSNTTNNKSPKSDTSTEDNNPLEIAHNELNDISHFMHHIKENTVINYISLPNTKIIPIRDCSGNLSFRAIKRRKIKETVRHFNHIRENQDWIHFFDKIFNEKLLRNDDLPVWYNEKEMNNFIPEFFKRDDKDQDLITKIFRIEQVFIIDGHATGGLRHTTDSKNSPTLYSKEKTHCIYTKIYTIYNDYESDYSNKTDKYTSFSDYLLDV